MEETTDRQQKLNDTRAVIDWLEAHPDVPLPTEIEYDGLTIASLNSKDEALMLTREFGSCEKDYIDTILKIKKRFGSVALNATFWRNEVCERVVVGTQEVPEQITPAHVREIVEWKCEPILSQTNEAAPENADIAA